MDSGWLLYLAAATCCQTVFALFYWLVLARLTTFGWNRAYMLSALVLSVALPLVALPTAWAQLVWPAGPTAADWALLTWKLATGTLPPAATAAPATGFSWLGLVLAVYWVGVAYQAWNTARNLSWLYRLRRQHPRTRLGRGWLVQLPEPSRPAFSFGRYVFLSPAHAQLNLTEYAQLAARADARGTVPLARLAAGGGGRVVFLVQRLGAVPASAATQGARIPSRCRCDATCRYSHCLRPFAAQACRWAAAYFAGSPVFDEAGCPAHSYAHHSPLFPHAKASFSLSYSRSYVGLGRCSGSWPSASSSG
jgi:hypothetical protein